MKSYEERRDERRERVADAIYELWRSGRNPDQLDMDRAYDMAYDQTGEEIARTHIHQEDAARERRAQQEYESESATTNEEGR